MTITLHPGGPSYPTVYLECEVEGQVYGTILAFVGRNTDTGHRMRIVTTVGYTIQTEVK